MCKRCLDCGEPIAEIRLAAVPDAEYCVRCADRHTEPVRCRMIFSHKTGGELFVARGAENIRLLENEYRRKR